MKRLLSPIPLCLYSAVLLALAFPGWSLHYLAWLALVPLIQSLRGATVRQGFVRGAVAGWVFHALLLHWLAANVFWAGGWALVGWLGLSAYLALYWGLLGGLYAWGARRLPGPLTVVLFASCWTLMEWGHAALLTGFGWSAVAYSQGPHAWIAQWAAIGGTHLIAFGVALTNGLLAQAAGSAWRGRAAYSCAAVLLAAVAHGGGRLLLGEAEYLLPAHRVGVFQSDFSQDMKWDPEYTVEMVDNAARKTAWLAANADVDLVVWPEALVMADPKEVSAIGSIIESAARDNGVAIFAGSVRDHPDRAEGYNSAYLVSPDGEFVSHYDKVHLAPMGEYVPFADVFPFLRSVVPSIGDVPAGDVLRVIDSPVGKLGPLICFEVLFAPDARALRDAGAERLVVITNLGWFGASAVLYQELEIARIRAIETRLPLIHAGNTGVSGVFDPYGRFTPVDTYVDPSGRTYTFADGAPLAHRTMQRLVGAFDLAEPAPRTGALPRDAVGIGAAVLAAAALGYGALRRRTVAQAAS